jgi:hypothetical protein
VIRTQKNRTAGALWILSIPGVGIFYASARRAVALTLQKLQCSVKNFLAPNLLILQAGRGHFRQPQPWDVSDMSSKSKIFAAALLAASAAIVAPASASPINPTYILKNAEFTDGATANGQFTIYTAGLPHIPYNYNITTTPGVLSGANYNYSVFPNPNVYTSGLPAGVGEIVQLQLTNYQGYLQLAFDTAINHGTVALNYTNSFECVGFAGGVGGCNGNSRYLVAPPSGKTVASTSVPEPSSISMLAAGLGMLAMGGLFLARRRKQTAAA